MNISKFIADCIEHRLRTLKISKIEFAAMLNTQPSTITRYLSGNHNFTVSTLEKIQEVLNINFFSYSEEANICSPCIVKDGIFLS